MVLTNAFSTYGAVCLPLALNSRYTPMSLKMPKLSMAGTLRTQGGRGLRHRSCARALSPETAEREGERGGEGARVRRW
jgi:hypothetical protein